MTRPSPAQEGTLLGVDAGGSSTDFLLTDRAGREVAGARTAGANITSLGVADACRVLEKGLEEVLSDGRISAEAIHAAVFGVAGVDREPQRSGLEDWLARTLPGARTVAVTDVELVLAAGTPDGTGLAIVSGTGSVAFGRDANGLTVKVGARGPVEGDPGSGHAIGLAAIASGHSHATSQDPADVAALVHGVVSAAEEGDTIAIGILQAAGRDLALQAVDAVSRMGWMGSAVPCALGGGVIVNVAWVRASFLMSARELGLLLEPVTIVPRPVDGAIRLARTLAGH
jgi:N-acetylmuramic acid 6-phosphate etherase